MSNLKAFDDLVLDPPRAGAQAQAAELARVFVTLTAGGYQLKSVTPIGQFLWSAHMEAVLERW